LKAGATAPLEPVKDGTVSRLKIMVAAYNAIFAPGPSAADSKLRSGCASF
jgi:hypothetical protein